MIVKILADSSDDLACLYDSVTQRAFGPVVCHGECAEILEAFLVWLDQIGRGVDETKLMEWFDAFLPAVLCEGCEAFLLTNHAERGGKPPQLRRLLECFNCDAKKTWPAEFEILQVEMD